MTFGPGSSNGSAFAAQGGAPPLIPREVLFGNPVSCAPHFAGRRSAGVPGALA